MKLHQLTALLEHSPDATVAVDVQGRISEWNPAAEAMFGWSRAEVLDAPIRRFVPSDGLAAFEVIWTQLAAGDPEQTYDTDRLHRDGTRTPVSVHVIAVSADGVFAGTVATIRPQSAPSLSAPRDDEVAAAQGSRDDDELTGLLGRRGLLRLLGTPPKDGMVRGVAVLNVDAFELVNQSYGPDVGDEALRELARRLAAAAEAAVVGRWQADEFMYLLDAEDAVTGLETIVAAALSAVRLPIALGEHRVYLSMSAGLATTTVVACEELLGSANLALRVAKGGGRDRAVWFEAAPRTVTGGGLRLANDLRRGLDAGEMRLLFQPIVALADHDVVGVEALVRWQLPGAGLLVPADFIDVAERSGHIIPLGAWVTEQACRAAVTLAHLSSAPHSMSINVSARQLCDPGVVDMVGTALRDSGADPGTIVIEVTETALTEDLPAATATLEAIKALGVGLALDDFGTGYSSLLYLKSFPVDRIKIDRSFIAGLGTDPDATAIVASTISLAHSIGVTAVAEGVETVDQLALLRRMRCDFAQGYLFSHPLTFGQLERWLRDHPPARRRRATVPAVTIAPESGRIVLLHDAGASVHTIAAALNVEGLRTAVGVRWSPQSVTQVIALSQCPARGGPDR